MREVSPLRLTGGLLFEVAERKGVTAGSLEVLPLPWFDKQADVFGLS